MGVLLCEGGDWSFDLGGGGCVRGELRRELCYSDGCVKGEWRALGGGCGW